MSEVVHFKTIDSIVIMFKLQECSPGAINFILLYICYFVLVLYNAYSYARIVTISVVYIILLCVLCEIKLEYIHYAVDFVGITHENVMIFEVDLKINLSYQVIIEKM